MSRRNFTLIVLFFLTWTLPARPDNSPPSTTQPTRYEQFTIIPLRVHILQSADIMEIECKLADADVHRIIGKVNGIWHQAGIHFGLDSIVREPAIMQDEFKTARAHDPTSNLPFRMLRPEASRAFDGLHVYYVHQLPVNGVYMGQDFAFVKETASLRPVEGGIDEPIPRVTAHELGHALGLPHRQNLTNLLASGTTGTSLNAAEIAISRAKAAKTKGALLVADLRKQADALSKSDPIAQRIAAWLAEVTVDAKSADEPRDRAKN